MTRIAGDPDAIVAVATKVVAAHDVELLTVAALRRAPIPELPASLAFAVPGLLNDYASRLERDAHEAERIARELARRALVLLLAEARSGESKGLRAIVALFGAGGRIRAEQRLLSLLRAGQLYQSEVMPIVRAAGPGSRAATEAWFFWQSLLPAYAVANRFTVAENLSSVSAYRAAGFGSVSGFGRLTGRVFGPLGMAGSAWTIAAGSPYPGVKGNIDRWVVAPAGFGSAGIVTAAALGVAVAPELLIAAGVVGVGVAGWTIWNERRAIGHALVTGGKYALKGAEFTWHHSMPGVIVDHRREIGHALVVGGEVAVHGTGDAVGWLGDRAKGVGAEALDVGGGAVHGAGEGLKGAGRAVTGGLKKLGGIFG